MSRRTLVVLFVIVLAASAGCSSSDPVFQGIQPYVLFLTAAPDSIPADGSSASLLLAIIVQVPDNGEDLGGIEVVFSTTLGGLAGTNDMTHSMTTTPEGAAGIALRGTGTAGMATVTASIPSLQLEEQRDVQLTAR